MVVRREGELSLLGAGFSFLCCITGYFMFLHNVVSAL